MENIKVGFIGGGNMANAIISGVAAAKEFPTEQIYVYDRHEEKLRMLKQKSGISTAGSEKEVVETCDIIFLAVKPQSFPELLPVIKPAVNERKIFVSIAAGISSSYITGSLSCSCPVIRAMPNTPLLIGKGATSICRTENVTNEAFAFVRSLFAACGTVTVMEESQMNAVISVGGSSPAYIYLFAKAMADSAVKQGIDAQTALEIICQTLEGSAEMLRQPGYTPDSLIKMVSSKGGTTIAALDVLYKNNFEQIIDEAMNACTKRAEELGK